MSESLKKMYEDHHGNAREEGFSVMKSDRGILFSKIIGKGKDILDLGCRDGALTSFFVKGNKVMGVDIDQISLARAAKNLEIETATFDIQSEWTHLGDRKFDVVVAGEFLEHVFYPDRVIMKVSNILKKDGFFIGSVPNAFSLKNRIKYIFANKKYTPLSDPTHINHFSSNELKGLLSQYFFDVEIVGIGRLGFIARKFPQLFAFDLCFIAKNKK